MFRNSVTNTISLGTILLTLSFQPITAQISEFEIWASDGAVDDAFGGSVSISGDYAIVGATYDDDNGNNSGSAYIYKRDGASWVQEAKLVPADGSENDQFGISVSIDGDYAAVGAVYIGFGAIHEGWVYIYKRSGSTWAQEAKLLAQSGSVDDAFGVSVSISGESLVVGASQDDDNGTNSGAAYVYKRSGTTWSFEAKLLASDGSNSDYFGDSVFMNGEYVIVGAGFDDVEGSDSGSAYVYSRSGTTWTEEQKLFPNNAAAGDKFGSAVSIYDDYALVGAPNNDANGNNSGSAYIFKRSGSTWNQNDHLIPTDGASDDFCGTSVCISGNNAVFGSRLHDAGGSNAGAAFMYTLSGENWIQIPTLIASDAANNDWFGRSVSVSGEYAIVGVAGDDDNAYGAGSAYLYKDFVPGILSVSPDSINFGYKYVEITHTEQVTVSNIGTADLNITSVSISGVNQASFSVDQAAFILIPGDSLSIDVEFTPATVGDYDATLDITSDIGDASIALSGTGIESSGVSRIVFVSNRDGNNEIYSMDADGSNQLNTSSHTSSDNFPSLSPDGSKILFHSNRDGDHEIFVMDSDGSNVTQLTYNSFNDQGAVFSPDASKIAYYNYQFGRTEVFVMDVDGSNQTRLTGVSGYEGWCYGAVWSPDGTRIAYRSDVGGNSNIWLMDAADGANKSNLTNTSVAWEENPSWSPDGSQIIFHSKTSSAAPFWNIWAIDTDGSNLINLSNNSDISDVYPSWSPDGNQIVYSSNANGEDQIFIMDNDGSNQVSITTNTDFDNWRP